MVLFLRTMFTPVNDRDSPGIGDSTTRRGDVVKSNSEKLRSLVNRCVRPKKCAPWTFGARDFMRPSREAGFDLKASVSTGQKKRWSRGVTKSAYAKNLYVT